MLAGRARALREWFRGFILKYKGEKLGGEFASELSPLNNILARDLQYGQVLESELRQGSRTASRLTWQRVRSWQTPESLLFPIAEAMAEFLSHHDLKDVKACEGATCTLLFLDRTRGHVRRWCSMTSCGNRAKQTAHRQRGRRAAD